MFQKIYILLVFLAVSVAQKLSLTKNDTVFFKSDTIRIEKVVQARVNLRDFFAAISNQYNTNIYVDQDIQIIDSYRFYNLTLIGLLKFIAERHKLDLKKENGIYRFSTRPKPKPKPKKIEKKELNIQFEENLLSLHLFNNDLRKVINKISDISDTSILLDLKLDAFVSGKLKKIPLEKGLRELLKINGLRLKKENGIFKVFKDYRVYKKSLEKKNINNTGFFVDYSDSLIVLDIPNAELSDVINILVQEADLNVVYYDDLTSKISMKLKLSSLDDAFVELLRNTEFAFKQEENIYYFGKRSRKDLVTQEVIKLKYLRAGKGGTSGFRDNSTIVNPFNSQDVGVGSFPNSSSSTRNNRQNDFNDEYSYRNNSRSNTVFNQNRSNTRSRSFSSGGNSAGFTSEALFEELSKREIDAVPLLEQNAVLITGTKIDIEDGRRIIKMLDRPIPQILIEALVIDIKDGDGLQQEIKAWRGKKTDVLDEKTIDTSYLPFSVLFNSSDINYWTQKAGELMGINVGKLPADFLAFVRHQETKQNIKIRSKPQIATLNGHEAYISVGETRYFKINSSYVRDNNTNGNQGTSGININEQWVSLEINNTLQIKPWVNLDGDVTVEIKPVLQSPREAPDDATPPSIDFRELESTVRLKNGETIILGGLISEEVSDKITDSFPLLSWIPWLGDIFVSKTKVKTKSELMIYVTPHVYIDEDLRPFIPKSDF
jgi:type IV pilus assembly protein PilQ